MPLIIEWEPGSEVVGDFVWAGFGGDIAISARALATLNAAEVIGFKPGPVEMWQDPKLVRPRRPRKRRVWLPYEGPPLHELWVTHRVHIDEHRSSVHKVRDCRTCGREDYEVEGVESWNLDYDRQSGNAEWHRVAREGSRGIFVRPADLQSAKQIFVTYELPTWILCTDLVKLVIETSGLPNIEFLEVGNISE